MFSSMTNVFIFTILIKVKLTSSLFSLLFWFKCAFLFEDWLMLINVSLEVLLKLKDKELVVKEFGVSAFWTFFVLGLELFLVGDVPFVAELVVILLFVLFSLFKLEKLPFSMWGLDADYLISINNCLTFKT